MIRRLVPPLLILPGTVLVLVPAVIIWTTHDAGGEVQLAGFDEPRLWLALLLTCAGLVLAVRTCRLFLTVGKGTPAPWESTPEAGRRGSLSIRTQPDDHERPLLAGSGAVPRVAGIGAWLLVFFLANAVYFPLVEEKALERRFGDPYRLYKANVPRWVPRISPWQQP